MKKLIFTYLTFGIFTISCNSQTLRVEDKLMNCIYQNYEDNGTKFKKALTGFEQLLINEKILKDSSGKSYVAIFEKIIEENDFNYNPSKSFLDKIIDIGMPQLESFIKCQSELKESKFIKSNELQKVFDSLKKSDNFSPSTVAKGILTVLNSEDFELDYYKMSVFFLFDTISYVNDDGLIRKLPETQENDTEYDLSKAINIYIDGNNQIFANKKKVDIDELKIVIKEYEEKNKSESIISLKAERETMYKTYIDVQNAIVGEIKKLRSQLAKKIYSKELDSLTKEEMLEIRKVYPQKLIE
ncbi:ExbD/TolR family protein [Tenacibaculum sp.]|uniref:ExbD/TolR family protein n=1 Tax=Tenacibaculum sp. TaxID=1906242 RepID=UPI003AA88324